MCVKKLGTVLGLLVLIAIGQTTFITDTASAGHNCWRPPLHCFFVYGSAEESDSASSLLPAESPSAILVESGKAFSSGKAGRKLFVYTDNSAKVEVEVVDDAKDYFKHYYKKDRIKLQGWILLYVNPKKPENLPVMVDIIPADPDDPYPGIPAQMALEKYIQAFEMKFPNNLQKEQ